MICLGISSFDAYFLRVLNLPNLIILSFYQTFDILHYKTFAFTISQVNSLPRCFCFAKYLKVGFLYYMQFSMYDFDETESVTTWLLLRKSEEVLACYVFVHLLRIRVQRLNGGD